MWSGPSNGNTLYLYLIQSADTSHHCNDKRFSRTTKSSLYIKLK